MEAKYPPPHPSHHYEIDQLPEQCRDPPPHPSPPSASAPVAASVCSYRRMDASDMPLIATFGNPRSPRAFRPNLTAAHASLRSVVPRVYLVDSRCPPSLIPHRAGKGGIDVQGTRDGMWPLPKGPIVEGRYQISITS